MSRAKAGGLLRVLVVNGPNLSQLETRPAQVYGNESWSEIASRLEADAKALGAELTHHQSDAEADLIRILQHGRDRFDALIINPGGLSHTSVALRDAIEAFAKPAIEVHLSNVGAREPFRHPAITGSAARGVISGLGGMGYQLALLALTRLTEAGGR